MRIEPKAFIAIEQSMAGAMKARWSKIAKTVVQDLYDALQAGDYAKAQEAANRITLDGVVKDVRKRLEELGVSALLFGAHRITQDVHTTLYARGEPISEALHFALNQLEHAVEVDAAEWVRKEVHRLIEEVKRADETAHVQKDDIAEADLAANGGLQNPEQVEDTAPKRRKRGKQRLTKKDGAKTLYVHRPLKNAWELIQWADAQGFKAVQRPEDMHVTICYSKEPFDWDAIEPKQDNVANRVLSTRKVQQFGDAVVLTFESVLLADDHQDLRDAGASYDFDHYQPHVTISWEKPPKPVDEIEPFQGVLDFGPEIFAPINNDWKDEHEEIILRKAEKTLAERINDCVVKGGHVQAELGAQLTTSRLITLGFLSQAEKHKVTRYRVDEVLDDRTCPVCAMMHGKVFNVAEQFGRTMQALSAQDPQDLKAIAPWPSQSEAGVAALKSMSNGELQSAGYGAPPYHAGCRGMLTEIGEEVEDFSSAAMDLAQQIIEGAAGDEATQAATPAATADLDSGAGATAGAWDDATVEQLGWSRFDVTDPEVFAAVDDAFQAKDYDEAQRLIAKWKAEHVEKEDNFEGPNQPKKKRVLQTPAGREQDYDDIRADVQTMNDNDTPLDNV